MDQFRGWVPPSPASTSRQLLFRCAAVSQQDDEVPFHRLIVSMEHPSSCLEAGRGYAIATISLSCRFRVIRDRTIGSGFRAHEIRWLDSEIRDRSPLTGFLRLSVLYIAKVTIPRACMDRSTIANPQVPLAAATETRAAGSPSAFFPGGRGPRRWQGESYLVAEGDGTKAA